MVLNLIDVFPTWRDSEGNPFAGRISCFDGTQTTQFKSIYTDYAKTTLSANPVTLGLNGKTPTQIFLDYGTYFIKVEKFLGDDYSTMEQYWNDSSYWETINQFTIDGGTAPQVFSDVRVTVDTIADLRLVDVNTYSTVAVLGYYAKGDTDVRTYVWVDGITNPDDYGKYIESSVSSLGRWVLCCSENIDGTWFGVFPSVIGNELTSRMTSLANYGSNCYQISLKKGVYYLNSSAIIFPCRVLFEGKFSSLANQTPVVTINELITSQTSYFEDADATIIVRKGTIKTSWFKSDNWQYINDGNTVVVNSSKSFNYKRTYSQVTFIIENSLLYSFTGTITFDYCIFYGVQIFSDPSLLNDSGAIFVFSNLSIRTSQLGDGVNLKVISDSPSATFLIDCAVNNYSSITNEINNCVYEKGNITSSVVIKIDILPKDGCLYGPIIVSTVSEARFYYEVDYAFQTLQKVILNGSYAFHSIEGYSYAGAVEVQGGELTNGTLSATTLNVNGTKVTCKSDTLVATNSAQITFAGGLSSSVPPTLTLDSSYISFTNLNTYAINAYKSVITGSGNVKVVIPVIDNCTINCPIVIYSSSSVLKGSVTNCVFNDPAFLKVSTSSDSNVIANGLSIVGNGFVSTDSTPSLLAIQGTDDSGFANSGHTYSIGNNYGSGRYVVQSLKGKATVTLNTLVVADASSIPATSSTPTAIVQGPNHYSSDAGNFYFYSGGISGIDYHSLIPFIGATIPSLRIVQGCDKTMNYASTNHPYVPSTTGYSAGASLVTEGIYTNLANKGTIMDGYNDSYSTYSPSYGISSSSSDGSWNSILNYSTIKVQIEWEVI